MAAKSTSLDAVKALIIDGRTIADLVTDRSGVTGEKMELDYYECVEGGSATAYIHPGNKLATVVAFAEKDAEYSTMRGVAMHIAAMSPVAIDESAVPQKIKDEELAVAIDKTKLELVAKEVEVALKKAGINPAHVDSEDHIESNMAKGWISAEDAAKAREIKATVTAEKTATLPEQKVNNIAAGRMAKFYKEYTLVEQKYEGGGEEAGKITVKELLAKKQLTCVAFKRVTLNQE
jgi:elongation factor Ts